MSSPHVFCARVLATPVLILSALLPSLGKAATDESPRYKLPVGRVLTYTSESQSKDENGVKKRDGSATFRVTVVAQNADGSSRVIVEQSSKYGDGEETKSVGGFDVSPQGKATSISGFNARV